ncbi:MAG TPA: YegS/Rv2252/BmrU family lipid kinase [Cyclobacteriaceae bacterium]|nr:YegS/Rv2252/BmrU family lipid kinase [Cyclobacteriaceae bacterium]
MTSATGNKQVLFIINKYSGTGYKPAVEGRLLSFCQQAGLEAHLEFTQGRGHATQLAREASQSKNFDVVFAMGGDGTVNEVAKGVVNTNQVMGIIPKGSGNGLARHLGIPLDFKKCLGYIPSEEVIAMDSFTVNNHLSINVSGIGFDGHIADLFGKNGKRGLANYARLVLQEFMMYNEISGEIFIDGTSVQAKAFVIAFANSSQFGNNARIAPYASVCDGELDISFVKKVPFLEAPAFAYKMFSGTLDKSNYIKLLKGKEISLRFSEPVAFHVDGEAMQAERKFEVKINPGSIRLLIPGNQSKNI